MVLGLEFPGLRLGRFLRLLSLRLFYKQLPACGFRFLGLDLFRSGFRRRWRWGLARRKPRV